MPDFFVKLSTPGEQEIDVFSGTFVTAKVCLGLSWNRSFVAYNVDTNYFAACTEAMLETYAK